MSRNMGGTSYGSESKALTVIQDCLLQVSCSLGQSQFIVYGTSTQAEALVGDVAHTIATG